MLAARVIVALWRKAHRWKTARKLCAIQIAGTFSLFRLILHHVGVALMHLCAQWLLLLVLRLLVIWIDIVGRDIFVVVL